MFGPFTYWRTATYGCILFLYFWGTAAGDERSDVRLEAAEWDEVCICL